MKLNRFTNQSQAAAASAWSARAGTAPWKTRPSPGRDAIPAPTAAICARNRSRGERPPRRSSSQEIPASPSAPTRATQKSPPQPWQASHNQSASQAASRTPTTAMPPPRGTARAWLERSLGRSMTPWRCSAARTRPVSAAAPAKPAPPAARDTVRLTAPNRVLPVRPLCHLSLLYAPAFHRMARLLHPVPRTVLSLLHPDFPPPAAEFQRKFRRL